MRLVEVKCPNCGGSFNANADHRTFTCNYCRSTFEYEDSNAVNININKIESYRDEYKIMKLNRQREIQKQDEEQIVPYLLTIVAVFCGLIVIAVLYQFFAETSPMTREKVVMAIFAFVIGGASIWGEIKYIRYRDKKKEITKADNDMH